MPLSANATYVIRDDKQASVEGLSAEEFYNGAFVQVHSRDHADNNGRAEAFVREAGAIPMGFCSRRSTGDAGTSPEGEAQIDLQGRVIKSLTVAGLAGTVADNLRLVYATDDGTFSLTRTAPNIPIGVVIRFRSASAADVLFFDFGTLCAIGMAGAGRPGLWLLGVVRAGLSTGDALTGIVAPCHGRIESVYGIVAQTATDADVDIDLNLEIGGTNVTGGVIEWVAADANAAKKAGTAITANNIFHEGDLIDIEATLNTAGTANDPGAMNVYANVLVEPGL